MHRQGALPLDDKILNCGLCELRFGKRARRFYFGLPGGPESVTRGFALLVVFGSMGAREADPTPGAFKNFPRSHAVRINQRKMGVWNKLSSRSVAWRPTPLFLS